MGKLHQQPRKVRDEDRETIRDLAVELFGTETAADFWLQRANPEFGGQTPQKLIEDGRYEMVRDFLAAFLSGEYS